LVILKPISYYRAFLRDWLGLKVYGRSITVSKTGAFEGKVKVRKIYVPQ